MSPPATASPPSPPLPRRCSGEPCAGDSCRSRRRDPRCRQRGERGLASQEWLLLIAAVASFTALAIFVLAETVDNSVERAGAEQPAREATATHAARLVENEARTVTADNWPMHTWEEWETYFDTKCKNIGNAFLAHGIEVTSSFIRPSGKSDSDLIVSPATKALTIGSADALAGRSNPAQISCEVG